MSNKIYIVTTGDYSDYHIVTVFLDRTAAAEFADRMREYTPYDTFEVEEHTIAEVAPKIIWCVTKGKFEDNFVDSVYDNTRYATVRDDKQPASYYNPNVVLYRDFGHTKEYTTYVLADTKDKATKIGMDLIAQYQALRAEAGEDIW